MWVKMWDVKKRRGIKERRVPVCWCAWTLMLACLSTCSFLGGDEGARDHPARPFSHRPKLSHHPGPSWVCTYARECLCSGPLRCWKHRNISMCKEPGSNRLLTAAASAAGTATTQSVTIEDTGGRRKREPGQRPPPYVHYKAVKRPRRRLLGPISMKMTQCYCGTLSRDPAVWISSTVNTTWTL